MSNVTKDGYHRLVFPDSVLWYPLQYTETTRMRTHTYCVARFPFVPHYHVCEIIHYDNEFPVEYPMQTFKTLAEALAVMRVLEASIKEEP